MIQGPSSYQMHVFGTLMPKLFAQSYADRIVEVDLSALRASHLEATTMLVIMEPAQPGQTITFTDYGVVRRGEIITRSQEAV